MQIKPDHLTKSWTAAAPKYSDTSAASASLIRSDTGKRRPLRIVEGSILILVSTLFLLAPGLFLIFIAPRDESLLLLNTTTGAILTALGWLAIRAVLKGLKRQNADSRRRSR